MLLAEYQEVRVRYREHGSADSELSEALLELITHMDHEDAPSNTLDYWNNYLYDGCPAVVAKELQQVAQQIIDLVPSTGLSADDIEMLYYHENTETKKY